MHGGQSRLLDSALRRSLVWRGDPSRRAILKGFQAFATDYYRRRSSLSTIFGNAGFDDAALHTLGNATDTYSLLMEFCPPFREWVHEFAGEKAMELVIEFYGLYGDPCLPLSTLEDNLELKNGAGYLVWVLNKLRAPDARAALAGAARVAGERVLAQRSARAK